MEHQVSKIRSAAFLRIRLIARVRRSLRRNAARILVKSLVVSYLYFCTPLLAGISATSLLRLQQILNAAFRLVYKRKKRDSICDTLKEEGILPIRQLIDLRILYQLHTIISTGQPSFLHRLIKPCEPQRHTRSEEQKLLHIPRTKSKNLRTSFVEYHSST